MRFAQRAHVRVVIHGDWYVEELSDALDEIEIAPSADVGREDDLLRSEIDGSAESDSAAVEFPGGCDGFDLVEHPFRASVAVGFAGFAPRHALRFEKRERKFGAS